MKHFKYLMKKLGMKLDGDELYEEFQRIYDESVGRDVDKEKKKIRCGIGAEEGDFTAPIPQIDINKSDDIEYNIENMHN